MEKELKAYLEPANKYNLNKVLSDLGWHDPSNTSVYVDENRQIIPLLEFEGRAKVIDKDTIESALPLDEVIVEGDPYKTFKIPVGGKIHNIRAKTLEEAIQLAKQYYDGDPSENFLNTSLFGILTGAAAGKLTYDAGKTGINAFTLAVLNPKKTASELVGGILGYETTDAISRLFTGKNFGEYIHDKTGIDEWTANLLNPGGFYGAGKGKLIYDKNLLSKFIKGDPNLGWGNLTNLKQHWATNPENLTLSNTALATVNRFLPFMNKYEKMPLGYLAREIMYRSKGNPTVSFKDFIKNKNSKYIGSVLPEGDPNRNLVNLYFKGSLIPTKRFKKSISGFEKVNKDLETMVKNILPDTDSEIYEMATAMPKGLAINTSPENIKLGIEYHKPTQVIPTPEGHFVVPTPENNIVGALDDIGNSVGYTTFDKEGKPIKILYDKWDFGSNYSDLWASEGSTVKIAKQASLLNNVISGKPPVLVDTRPITINNNPVYNNPSKIPADNSRKKWGVEVVYTDKRLPLYVVHKFQTGGQFTPVLMYLNNEDKNEPLNIEIPNLVSYTDLLPVRHEVQLFINNNIENFNEFSSSILPDQLFTKPYDDEQVILDEEEDSQEITKKDSNGKFTSKTDFIITMNREFRKALNDAGLPQEYSKILTSVAALESGWGKHLSGSYNYGGIKAKKGSRKQTVDYVNGKYVKRFLTFRDFKSIKDYCDYTIDLLQNNRYRAFVDHSPSDPLLFWSDTLDRGYAVLDSKGKTTYMNSIRKILNTVNTYV